MLTIENHKSQLIVALAVFGLMMSLSVSKASAQGNSDYIGRYACSSQEETDDVTAIYKYGPNGAGAYNTGGVLVSALSNFTTVALPGSGDFCVYTIDPVASSYHLGSDDFGFENLVWDAASTNDPTCPATFNDQTAIGVRRTSGVAPGSIRADFASVNLLGEDEPGYGKCLR